MFTASKTGWAGIAIRLLTTGMLVLAFPRSAAGSDCNKEGVAAVRQNEIKKMQETLRNKGQYRSRVGGASGLRTRSSIRAYQKAENLPVAGQLESRTPDKLGVRPVDREETGYETAKGKPSAGIKRAKGSGRTGKTPWKAVNTVAAPERGQAGRQKTIQAENAKA